MMKKIDHTLFYLLSTVMLLLALYWLITGTMVLSGATVSVLFALTFVAFVGLLFPRFYKKVYQWLVRYKFLLLGLSVVYQLVLLLSTNLMIRSDAAMVFNGAMKLVDTETISLYLSRYPNNLLLFLYERFFYHLFGMKAIWVMQGINIGYSTFAGWLLYKLAQKNFRQEVADNTLLFYLAFIGYSPQSLTVYTDIMVLPVIVGQLYLMLDLFREKPRKASHFLVQSVALALLTALGVLIRPTLIILPLAALGIQLFMKSWKNFLAEVMIFVLVFISSFLGLRHVQNQQKEVQLHKEYSITALAYIDLGLTYIGTDQIDFQTGLSLFVDESTRVDEQYDGRFSNKVVLQDIKRRLKEYTPSTFLGHVLEKQSLTMRDGTLGWTYKDASKEGAAFINPLYPYTKDNPLAEWIRRHLIYTDQGEYNSYRFLIQAVYLVLISGFVLQFARYDSDRRSQMFGLAVFGGLLFLMIFEGGKTRYLIQFLPQMLLLSSLGYVRKEGRTERKHD